MENDRKRMLDELENLSVILLAIKDALSVVGTDDDVDSEISKLADTAREYRCVLEKDHGIGRLIRVNRELREHLDLIRDIVSDAEPKIRMVSDED